MTTFPRLAALVLLAVTASAADRWVGPAGSDTTGTGSAGAPYREIRKALTVVQPGDTIRVLDGSYLGFTCDSKLGTAALPIVIRAEGANAVLVKTTDRTDNRDTVFITDCTYLTLQGFRSFDANRAAIRIHAGHHVTIRGCTLGDNARWGILTGHSDDLLIEGNECYGSIAEHGIYTANSGDRPVIRANRVHHNYANGIHMNADRFQGGDGIISDALVERNVIWENGTGGGSGINCDGVIDSVIRGNLIHSARGAGISLYMIDAAAPATGNLVVANTIEVGPAGKWCLQIHNGSANAIVFDNIFASRHANRGGIHIDSAASASGLQCNRNAFAVANANRIATLDDDTTYLTFAQWQATGRDANGFASTQAALFTSPAGFDFTLKAGSPALDVGVTSFAGRTAPTVDLVGTTRPAGAGYDLGAYERPAASTTTSGTTTSGSTTSGTTSGTTTSGSTTSGTTTSGTTTSGTTTSSSSTSGSGATASTGSGTMGSGSGGSGSSGCGLGAMLGLLGLALVARRRR